MFYEVGHSRVGQMVSHLAVTLVPNARQNSWISFCSLSLSLPGQIGRSRQVKEFPICGAQDALELSNNVNTIKELKRQNSISAIWHGSITEIVQRPYCKPIKYKERFIQDVYQ